MAGKSRTGVKASYQKGGLNVEGEYTMADAFAALAGVAGLAGLFVPGPGWATSAVLLTGSGAYFGANYLFPGKKALTNPSGENLIFFAAGAGIVYYCMKKKGGSAPDGPTLFASAPPSRILPATALPVSRPVDATPAVTAATAVPGGAEASPTRGQVIPLPRSQDTNLWWWPDEEEKENLGFISEAITGAQYAYDRLTGSTEEEAVIAAYERQQGRPATEEEKAMLVETWEEPSPAELAVDTIEGGTGTDLTPFDSTPWFEPPSTMDLIKPVAIVGGTGLLIYLVMRNR